MASAIPVRPATSPAPPVAAASLSSVWRSNRFSNLSSPSICVPSLLVARRTDHEHHLCGLVARVRDAMGCRALVVDAVPGAELVDVGAELQVNVTLDHDQELLRVAVRVGLVSRRAAGFEQGDDDLERVERLRRQERLPAELAPGDELPRAAPEHAWLRRARREEVGDLDAEGGRESLQRRDRCVRATALQLAEEALADARRRGDLFQGLAPQLPDRPQSL